MRFSYMLLHIGIWKLGDRTSATRNQHDAALS